MLTGLAATEGKNAVPVLTAEIESQNAKVQGAAIRLLNGIPGQEITAVLVRQYPKLPASSQVRLLAALAERGDASAGPLLAWIPTGLPGSNPLDPDFAPALRISANSLGLR